MTINNDVMVLPRWDADPSFFAALFMPVSFCIQARFAALFILVSYFYLLESARLHDVFPLAYLSLEYTICLAFAPLLLLA